MTASTQYDATYPEVYSEHGPGPRDLPDFPAACPACGAEAAGGRDGMFEPVIYACRGSYKLLPVFRTNAWGGRCPRADRALAVGLDPRTPPGVVDDARKEAGLDPMDASPSPGEDRKARRRRQDRARREARRVAAVCGASVDVERESTGYGGPPDVRYWVTGDEAIYGEPPAGEDRYDPLDGDTHCACDWEEALRHVQVYAVDFALRRLGLPLEPDLLYLPAGSREAALLHAWACGPRMTEAQRDAFLPALCDALEAAGLGAAARPIRLAAARLGLTEVA